MDFTNYTKIKHNIKEKPSPKSPLTSGPHWSVGGAACSALPRTPRRAAARQAQGRGARRGGGRQRPARRRGSSGSVGPARAALGSGEGQRWRHPSGGAKQGRRGPRRRRRPVASSVAAGPLARAPGPAALVRCGGGARRWWRRGCATAAAPEQGSGDGTATF